MSPSASGRKDRMIQQKRHDVYKETDKWPEPTVCQECGALFADGRWSWKEPPKGAHEVTCPACKRMNDRYPAGYLEMRGKFLESHRQEIFNLMRNIEEQEKGERPLERIMEAKEEKDHTLVTTTGVHLARRMGEALSRAYKGELSFQYVEAEKLIRVYWER